MESGLARKLFDIHSKAIAYIDVEKPDGDRGIGSAFHVGEGVFVTARHVVSDNKIIEMRMTEPVPVLTEEYMPYLSKERAKEHEAAIAEMTGETPYYKHWTDPLELEVGPIFPENENVDLAVFKVSNIHHAASVAKLGLHFDDWIYRHTWQMSEALVLGYPPIPNSTSPNLVAAKAEIHTFTPLTNSPFVHFILSASPRGGFSGGLAVHEDGFVLGVVTTALTRDDAAPETGFMAVLSIEPIWALLEQSDLVSEKQQENRKNVLGFDPSDILKGFPNI